MLLIADTSPLLSLLIVEKIDIIEKLFPDYYIPKAVWLELINHNEIKKFNKELAFLEKKVRLVNNFYPLSGIDVGEIEAIILYKELNANFLLIDDKRARQTAEALDINCIGTLAILFKAKEKGLISKLRPLFEEFLKRNRYYSKKYLNYFLSKADEKEL